MLRASSLGLAFTHGISRCYLHPRPYCLHRQLGHETRPVVPSDIPHMHTKEAIEMSPSMLEPVKSEPRPPSTLRGDAVDGPSTATPSHRSPEKTQDVSAASTTAASEDTTQSRSPSTSSEATKGPWRPEPPSFVLDRYAARDHQLRQPLYQKLVDTTDIDEAWETYQELLKYKPAHLKQSIPHKYLHSFAARLVRRSRSMPPFKPRTQKVFLRLLSVLNTIYQTGGQLRLWEWNALIECAGRGWRKTRMENFQASLNIYRDMVANRAPGSSFVRDDPSTAPDDSRVASEPVTPDVVTYTTLISIAVRTLDPRILRIAESMLASSGIPPNRITYLAYLRYYTRKGRLGGVRSTMYRVLENGWELGQEGINALIWAFGRNGRLDIADSIYRVLRHNLLGYQPSEDGRSVQSIAQELQDTESITIPESLKPDAITYYTLIQVYAYHGHFRDCLRVFADMMTSPVPLTGTFEDMEEPVSPPTLPNPVLPIFRSIFLGFVRHARLPEHEPHTEPSEAAHEPARPVWTLEQLHALFGDFIELPQPARPNSRTVYWLLVAFAISSGYDRGILREVWERLEARYGGWWDGRVDELRSKIYAEEFDRAYFDRLRTKRQRQRRGWEP
ncbi:hypothetical protein BV20DRAFT_1008431 [Pilatotrama ljubarskyi]|nr:hypothetical protein BV20DRAFT_1008431 [Pilatotrama ljubarskyi]